MVVVLNPYFFKAMSNIPQTLYITRYDLRLSDNPALKWALERGSVLAVFIDDDSVGHGPASRWWLEQALKSLNTSMSGRLNVYRGNRQEIITSLAKRFHFDAVVWNQVFEPNHRQEDLKLEDYIQNSLQLSCQSFNGSLLWEPSSVTKADGGSYQVFSPFYFKGAANAPAPRQPVSYSFDSDSLVVDEQRLALENLTFGDHSHWSDKFVQYWQVREQAAWDKLDKFIQIGLKGYKDKRNFPGLCNHTSQLSPYLRYGLISPHQVWHYVQKEGHDVPDVDLQHFLSELGWREFSYYLLHHFPHITEKNFQPKFDNYPWQWDKAIIDRWKSGTTGYPIVDAGMRQLYEMGYMHNRLRMIVASFLVKNLSQHWHVGRDYFHECLVDADTASNNASWQWVSGCGADAAPYFRIFNPILQGEKFDKDGAYTKKWVPELANLPSQYLHKPWEAPEEVLKAANVSLGKDYPLPLVDCSKSRDQALAYYQEYVRNKAKEE